MAASASFRKIICPAIEAIAFNPQIGVYFGPRAGDDQPQITLEKVTTANIGVVDGALVADFHLPQESFIVPEEIAITSVISDAGTMDATGHTALRITGIVIERRQVADIS
jgi:hypothetical protein